MEHKEPVSPFSEETLGQGLSVLVSPEHGFGTDALLLADFVSVKPDGPAIDLGTGCGIIPLLLRRRGANGPLYGLELQEQGYCQFSESLTLSKERGGFVENMTPILGDLRDIGNKELPSDHPVASLPLGSFKTVTMNPPYKPVDTGILSDMTAEQIARHETTCTIKDAAKAASALLNFGGNFAVCHRPERLADVLEAFREASIEPKRLRFVQKRPDTPPWLFLLEGRKGGKPYLQVLPPLYIQDETGGNSEELNRILGEYQN